MSCGGFDDIIDLSNEPILWLKVLLNFWLWYESLEPLVDFLGFLVPKLWQKIRNISGFLEEVGGFS